MIRNLTWPALIVAAVAQLVACAGPTSREGDRLRVVATTTQVGAVAREVGGNLIELTILLEPGVEAHDFELTPSAAAALEDADIILKSGAGLESWLEDALTTIGGDERVRDMSVGIKLRAPAADAVAEGDATDEGSSGEIDPHYWLSAPGAIGLVEHVRDALGEAEPVAADAFDTNAVPYVSRLRAADVEIRRLMAEIPPQRRGIVTNHDALGYFIAEYGLRYVGSVFPSLDVSAEPNPAQLAELVDTVRREQVTAIFAESAVNPRLAEAIAADSGARVVDDPLYTDSLGAPGSGADTLDGMLLHNATVIHDALVEP